MKYYITTDVSGPYAALTEHSKYIGTNLTQALEAADNDDYVYTIEFIRREEITLTREVTGTTDY